MMVGHERHTMALPEGRPVVPPKAAPPRPGAGSRLFIALLLAWAGCASDSTRVMVYGAASLTDVLSDIAEAGSSSRVEDAVWRTMWWPRFAGE